MIQGNLSQSTDRQPMQQRTCLQTAECSNPVKANTNSHSYHNLYIYIYTHTHTHIYIYIYIHTHTYIHEGKAENKVPCFIATK